MISRTIFILFLGCLHQAASDEVPEVKTRRVYDSSSDDRSSLPDVVQFDLKVDGAKIRWNLVRDSVAPELPPIMVSGANGQSEEWKPPKTEKPRTYKDPIIGASGTVNIYNDEIQIVATFRHGKKMYSLLPEGMSMPVLKKVKGQVTVGFADGNEGRSKASTRSVSIDGSKHSIIEMTIKRSEL